MVRFGEGRVSSSKDNRGNAYMWLIAVASRNVAGADSTPRLSTTTVRTGALMLGICLWGIEMELFRLSQPW